MSRALGVVLVLGLSATLALGAVEFVLKNGQKIRGTDFRLEGDLYIVKMESGGSVTLPKELVSSMELTGEGEDAGDIANVVSSPEPPARADSGRQAAAPPDLRAIQPPSASQDQVYPGVEQRRPPPDLPPGFRVAEPEDLGKSDWDGGTWQPEDALKDNRWVPEDAFKKRKTSFRPSALVRDSKTDSKSPMGEGPLEEGLASWYGERFHGKTTASGKPYDMNAFTAAHPSLPFGTLVMVTNERNQKSLVLEITDRGPSIEGRIINLSFAAAQQIEMVQQGIVPVHVQILGT
jgi:hypothetical protein